MFTSVTKYLGLDRGEKAELGQAQPAVPAVGDSPTHRLDAQRRDEFDRARRVVNAHMGYPLVPALVPPRTPTPQQQLQIHGLVRGAPPATALQSPPDWRADSGWLQLEAYCRAIEPAPPARRPLWTPRD